MPITTPSRVRISLDSGVGPRSVPGARDLREAEGQDLHAPVLRHYHVGGLEITVDDAIVGSGGQGVGQARGDLQYLVDRKAAPGNDPIEVLAFDGARIPPARSAPCSVAIRPALFGPRSADRFPLVILLAPARRAAAMRVMSLSS